MKRGLSVKTQDNKKQYKYDYPMADNTVDAVVFGIGNDHTFPGRNELHVLLIERRGDPFKGRWALPGGYLEENETIDDAVLRELKEETSVELSWMEQLYTFGDPGRDPRGRVISTAYLAVVRASDVIVEAGDDAAKARWFPISVLPKLAFDHDKIIKMGLQRLRSKVLWQPVGINLLPETFTLTELQTVYETILGRKLDRRNFRAKVLKLGVLTPNGKKQQGGRPAIIYRFNRDIYKGLQEQGVEFEIRYEVR